MTTASDLAAVRETLSYASLDDPWADKESYRLKLQHARASLARVEARIEALDSLVYDLSENSESGFACAVRLGLVEGRS